MLKRSLIIGTFIILAISSWIVSLSLSQPDLVASSTKSSAGSEDTPVNAPLTTLPSQLPNMTSQASASGNVRSMVVIGTATNTSAAEPDAKRIETLPVAMQQEIQSLSGRDNSATTVVETQPSVFLMTNGPRTVPVAVINEDGTVTIHEY